MSILFSIMGNFRTLLKSKIGGLGPSMLLPIQRFNGHILCRYCIYTIYRHKILRNKIFANFVLEARFMKNVIVIVG